MATITQKLSIANFTLKFGSFEMLDMFELVVYPAFFSPRVRRFGDSTYVLHQVKLLEDEDEELYIAGRLVKNTIIARDQILRNGELVEDRQAMESAPSCFFVLQLSNHKLFFVRETSQAPMLSTFEATLQAFLTASYKEFLENYYRQTKEQDPSFSWNKAHEAYPRPTLKVTPMASANSLHDHLRKYRTIRSVEVRLLKTNHELDNSPLFSDMREVGQAIGADEITVRTQRKGEEGLDKVNVERLIRPQAEGGIARIKIDGTGINGDKLRTENESFNLSLSIARLGNSVLAAAASVIDKVKSQISLGIVEFQEGDDAKVEALKEGILRDSYERLR